MLRPSLGPVGRVVLTALVISCGGEAGQSSSSSGEPTPGGNSSSGSSGTTSSSGTTPTDKDAGVVTPTNHTGIRFVAVGDTGTGDNPQQKVGNSIAAVCKERGCDFVQLLGDNLYQSGADSPDDPIWQTHFETPYAAVEQEFWVVLGNHDYGHDGAGTDFGKGQNEIDYSTKSAKWKLPSAYWHKPLTKTDASLEVFGLDTNSILWGRDSDQKKDVDAWLAASTATWKIAMGHHPYKSNGDHGNAGDYDAIAGISVPPINGKNVKEVLEDHVCGKVDLYLAGHDHSRQWINESCKGTELAVSGAGAKATELDGENPALFQSLELGFLYIIIEGKKLTAEFVDENGKTEFTHTITKP